MTAKLLVLFALFACIAASCDVQSLIKTNEGYSTCVYVDTMGHPTIGIGFNLDRSDAPSLISAQGFDYNSIRAGTTCLSDSAVMNLFQQDVAKAQACARQVDSFFGSLSSSAQAVVTDLIFNMGCSKYKAFTGFNSYLARGDMAGAANDLRTQTAWCGQVRSRCTRDCSCLTA